MHFALSRTGRGSCYFFIALLLQGQATLQVRYIKLIWIQLLLFCGYALQEELGGFKTRDDGSQGDI